MRLCLRSGVMRCANARGTPRALDTRKKTRGPTPNRTCMCSVGDKKEGGQARTTCARTKISDQNVPHEAQRAKTAWDARVFMTRGVGRVHYVGSVGRTRCPTGLWYVARLGVFGERQEVKKRRPARTYHARYREVTSRIRTWTWDATHQVNYLFSHFLPPRCPNTRITSRRLCPHAASFPHHDQSTGVEI